MGSTNYLFTVRGVMGVKPCKNGKTACFCCVDPLDDILKDSSVLAGKTKSFCSKKIYVGIALTPFHLFGGGKKIKAIVYTAAL